MTRRINPAKTRQTHANIGPAVAGEGARHPHRALEVDLARRVAAIGIGLRVGAAHPAQCEVATDTFALQYNRAAGLAMTAVLWHCKTGRGRSNDKALGGRRRPSLEGLRNGAGQHSRDFGNSNETVGIRLSRKPVVQINTSVL